MAAPTGSGHETAEPPQRLGRHLAHEENDAIRIVQSVMTVEEWTAFEDRIGESIKLSQVFKLVPWAMHGLSGWARRQVFAAGGTAHRVLWMLSRRRFERLDRRAFRHLRG